MAEKNELTKTLQTCGYPSGFT